MICQRILAGGQSELLGQPAMKRYLFNDQYSTIKNAALIALATNQE